MSATTRILLGFLVFLAVGLFALVTQLVDRVERQYLEAAEEPMVETAHLLASLLGQHLDAQGNADLATFRAAFSSAGDHPIAAKIYDLTKTSINMNVYVTDRHGRVIFDSDGGRAEGQDYRARRDVALTLAGEYGARATADDPKDLSTATMFVGAPLRHEGRIVGVVSVSKPQRAMYHFIRETHSWIRWLGLTAFALMALGAVLVTSLFSRPIHRLTAYAHAIARGERVAAPALGSPEVATLGRAFEEMRDALEDRRYVENYVQTLTHEMKSPVAAIRGAAELLREEMTPENRLKFLGNIQAEARRLQNLIDRLLALSALESRKALERPEPVSLVELIEAVCAQLQPAAEARQLTLENRAADGPTIRGEFFLLEIALTNLLQNAIDFSPAGGRIAVTLTSGEDAPWVEIVTEDQGPGIPDYAVARVFERFYSLQHPATGRKSSGLGLCFVREAVELHGGRAEVTNRRDRSGVRAVMRFPLGRTS